MMKVLMYNEGIHDKTSEEVKQVYPNGLHGRIGEIVREAGHDYSFVTLENVLDITKERLEETDVLIWWGHMAHDKVPDQVVALVKEAVVSGMGLIVLHSGHHSKVFRSLTGCTGSLGWHNRAKERVWRLKAGHPIAAGIPEQFVLDVEEVYAEPFDIPRADDVVFASWFSTGEIFRSGVTFSRGHGKIFYFQPGHETFESFYNPYVVRIIQNAVSWAAPTYRAEITCPNIKPSEPV